MIPALFRSNFMMCAPYSMEDLRLLNLNRKQSTHRFVIKCKIWKTWHFCLFVYTVSFFSLQVQCLCDCYFAAFLWILLASSYFYLALLTRLAFVVELGNWHSWVSEWNAGRSAASFLENIPSSWSCCNSILVFLHHSMWCLDVLWTLNQSC